MLAAMTGGDIVRLCAIRLFERHMLPSGHRGACYFLTFLLHHHLAIRHKIATKVFVGFINDSTDNIWGSHAWLEYEGKKTDLAIYLPLHPEASPRGHALVVGDIVRQGEANYRYVLEVPTDAKTDEELIQGVKDEALRNHVRQNLAQKRDEHAMMLSLSSGSLDLVYAYLSAAPGPPYSHYERVMG